MEAWFLLLLWCSAIRVLVHQVEGQDRNSGYISIDCGAPYNYPDNDLQIDYVTDDGFIESGTNMQISTDNIYANIQVQGKNLRMFPEGERNCYTLRPDKGKNNTYLVRAEFYYGNYDNKNQIPSFDLHIGVNYWDTIYSSDFIHTEIFYVPPTDDIQVCLINTGNGIPFISSLELWPLDNSIYQLSPGRSLLTHWRYNIGGSTFRHPEDVYDRIWTNGTFGGDVISTTSLDSLSYDNDEYKVPAEVMSTAEEAADVYSSLDLFWTSGKTTQWCIYFHFAELELLPSSLQRELKIFLNGILIDTVTLQYLTPVTKSSCANPITGSDLKISIKSAEGSEYPPILNAVEAFTVIELPSSATKLDDVNAMNDIKKLYGLKRVSWQGDPCVPNKYIWDGLDCSYNDNVPPRIVSLDLSSSALSGDIV